MREKVHGTTELAQKSKTKEKHQKDISQWSNSIEFTQRIYMVEQ